MVFYHIYAIPPQELNKSESVLRARAIVAFHLGNFRSPSHHHCLRCLHFSLGHFATCHHWWVPSSLPSLPFLPVLLSSPSIASISNIVIVSLIPICIVHHRHHHHEKSDLKVNPANQTPIEITHLIVYIKLIVCSWWLSFRRWLFCPQGDV